MGLKRQLGDRWKQDEFIPAGDAAKWLVAETIGLSFEGLGKFSCRFDQAFPNAPLPEVHSSITSCHPHHLAPPAQPVNLF